MDPLLVLTVLCSAAELFAFYRFVRARVHRRLPWFSAYLVAGVLQSFTWLAGPPNSHGYANAYGLTTPLIIGLQVLVFVEICRKSIAEDAAADHGHRAAVIGIVSAALVLGVLSGIDGLALRVGVSRGLLFMWISWCVRYSATVLCVACSLLAVVTASFHHKPSAYVTRHIYLLAAYFASIAAGYLVINLKLLPVALVGALTVGSAAGLYVLWGILLTGSGVTAPVPGAAPGIAQTADGMRKQIA